MSSVEEQMRNDPVFSKPRKSPKGPGYELLIAYGVDLNASGSRIHVECFSTVYDMAMNRETMSKNDLRKALTSALEELDKCTHPESESYPNMPIKGQMIWALTTAGKPQATDGWVIECDEKGPFIRLGLTIFRDGEWFWTEEECKEYADRTGSTKAGRRVPTETIVGFKL